MLKWKQLDYKEFSHIWMGDGIYPTHLHERMDVLEEKFHLFPIGCIKLVMGDEIVGYGISHPWMFGKVPKLDSFLKELPPKPDCLYLHDCAILEKARGYDMGCKFVEEMEGLANKINVKYLTGTSVMGTYKLWCRYGFEIVPITDNLETYGEDAKYIIKDLN